jgi:hydrogenase maturation protease
MAAARTLLIGYGNTLRGDDALGPMAVEQMRAALPYLEFVSCHQLGPELAGQMAAFDCVVFLDASSAGEPGTVQLQRLQAGVTPAGSFTHHMHPAVLLELAQTLYGRAPKAMLATGVGASFESGEGLSEAAQRALDEICRVVPRLLQSPDLW